MLGGVHAVSGLRLVATAGAQIDLRQSNRPLLNSNIAHSPPTLIDHVLRCTASSAGQIGHPICTGWKSMRQMVVSKTRSC